MVMLHTGFYRDGAHLSLLSAGCKSLGFPGIDWCLCRKHEPHWVCQYYGLLPDKVILSKCLWWPSGVINIAIGLILERLLSSTTHASSYVPLFAISVFTHSYILRVQKGGGEATYSLMMMIICVQYTMVMIMILSFGICYQYFNFSFQMLTHFPQFFFLSYKFYIFLFSFSCIFFCCNHSCV